MVSFPAAVSALSDGWLATSGIRMESADVGTPAGLQWAAVLQSEFVAPDLVRALRAR